MQFSKESPVLKSLMGRDSTKVADLQLHQKETPTQMLPVNSPSFDGNLPIYRFSFFLTPGFWAKAIFCCFFKIISQIRFISIIYCKLWNVVTLDNFLSFYLFLFLHTFIVMVLLEKTFSPSCTAFKIRCTPKHTWLAGKSLNISEFGNFFRGDFRL